MSAKTGTDESRKNVGYEFAAPGSESGTAKYELSIPIKVR
jgi:hypothetical protein